MRIAPVEFLQSVVRRMFEATIFFIPLFALPWTVSPLEINKQAIFYVFATIAILAWLGQTVLTRTLEVRLSNVWIPFLVFLGAVAISAGLSPDAYTSIFGQAEQEYTSLVTMIFGLVFAFVGTQTFDAKAVRRFVTVGMVSAAIVGCLGILPFFGISFSVLPTNVIGTPNALVLYLLIMSLLSSGIMMLGHHDSRHEYIVRIIATAVIGVATLALLLAIDYSTLWVLTIFGAAVVFGLALLHPTTLAKPVRFIVPMILFVTAVFFIMLPSMMHNPFLPEVALSTKGSWTIARDVFGHGGWAFGTGPGTYAVDFAQYHSADLNATQFWDTRFDRGSSALMTMLATLGIFATFAWGVGLLFAFGCALLAYQRAQHPHDLGILAAWAVLAAAWVCYPQNFTFVVMFWVFSSLMFRALPSRHVVFAFERSPRAGFAVTFLFAITSVFILTVAFATVSKYRADITFARATTLYAAGGDIDDVILALDHAATLNRWSDVYYRNLGIALVQKVAKVVEDPESDPELVRALIGAAVNASVRATELGPTNVTNWELRGDVYRSVSPYVSDAASFAIVSYERAGALAPNNPKYRVALARGYVAYAETLTPSVEGDDEAAAAQAKIAQEEALQNATTILLEAIALKADYVEARYFLASVQELQGKLAEAVASMELVRASAPRDVGVGLQLALLYLRQGKNDIAKQELARIISIAPNFANAHWFLASILEEAGDIDGALAELEIIIAIDPAQDVVQKKIDALRAGQVAATPIPEPLPTEDPSALPDAPVTP